MSIEVEDARTTEALKKAAGLLRGMAERLPAGTPEEASARLALCEVQEALHIVSRRRVLSTTMDYAQHCNSPRLYRRSHEFYSQVAAIDWLPARK